jgi:cytoskeletal protein CcmA (bactofilin family)
MQRFFRKSAKAGSTASNAHGNPSSRESAEGEAHRAAERTPAVVEPPRPPAASAERTNAAARDSSVIGRNLVFKGILSAAEDLLIQGRVEGSIDHRGATLTIGAHGDIKADVSARRIIVHGKVRGDLRASESITVESTGQIHGDVFAPRVALEEGARFKGAIDMGAAPLGSAAHEPNDTGAKTEAGNADVGLGEGGVNAILEHAHS